MRSPIQTQERGGAFAVVDMDATITNAGLSSLGVEEVLRATDGWEQLSIALQREIDTVYKQPFSLRPEKRDRGVDIPINAGAYAEARFTNSAEPQSDVNDLVVLRDVQFGYVIKGQFRPAGRINFIALNKGGRVVEVGCAAAETLQIFRENIFGRDITPSEIERQYEVNEMVIEALRRNTECAAALSAFAAKRGHQPEWAKSAQLAYYSPAFVDLLSWGASHGVTAEELYQAGFVDRQVTTNGVRYINRKEDVVFIPFHNDEGRIVLWRMRLENPQKDDPKYRSAPLDRAHRRDENIYRQLYQAELLQDVAGKLWVITEGEFKCLVAAQMTGVATVGITGITQVTDEIIEQVVAANPSQIIIILDRDPIGKGLSRIDRLTDSERAAYLIARRLTRAGHPNVTIGRLPDAFEGGKVGIDDLLLHVGADQAKAALAAVIADSVTVEQREAQVDSKLQDLFERRQRINQTLRDYTRFVERAPQFTEDPQEHESAEMVLTQLTDMSKLLDRYYREYLAAHYQGARRINQPPMSHLTLFGTSGVNEAADKFLTTADGRNIQLSRFTQDLLVLRAHPADLPDRYRLAEAPGFDFPFSMEQLTRSFHGHAQPSHKLLYTFNRGRTALEEDCAAAGPLPWEGMSYHDFVQAVFAGYLADIYPSDEYAFKRDLRLRKRHTSYWEEAAVVAIAVLKDNERPVALCSLPHWEHRGESDPGIRAAQQEARQRAAIRSFLRNPKLHKQQQQLEQICEILVQGYFDKNLTDTSKVLAPYGISEDVIRETRAVTLQPSDWSSLIPRLRGASLLNQSFQAGLLVSSQDGFARPRLSAPATLIPDRDISGRCLGFAVIPHGPADRINGSLPPVPKAAHILDTPRNLSGSFNLRTRLFMEHSLNAAKGRTVVVVSSEIEALQLQSAIQKTALSDLIVVAIRELEGLESAACRRLAEAEPDKVVFISGDGAADPGMQRHGALALHDAESAAQLFLETCGESNPSTAVLLLSSPLGEILQRRQFNDNDSFLSELLNGARQVDRRFLRDDYAAAKRGFSEALLSIERAVADSAGGEPQLLTQGDAIEILQGYYSVIVQHAEPGALPENLEQFLAARYGVSPEDALSAMFEGKKLNVYRYGRAALEALTPALRDQLTAVSSKFDLNRIQAAATSLSTPQNEIRPLIFHSSTNREGYSSLERELLFIARHHHVEWHRDESSSIRLCGRSYYRHQLAVQIGGVLFRGEGLARSKGAARDLAAHQLRRAAAGQDGVEAQAMQRIGAELKERIGWEHEIRRANNINRLHEIVRRMVKAGMCAGLEEDLPQVSPDGATYMAHYRISVEGRSFIGMGDGISPRASQHLAAADLLSQLKAAGIFERVEQQDAEKAIGTVREISAYHKLKERLSLLALANQVEMQEQYTPPGAHTPELWGSNFRVVVNGMVFEASGPFTKKKSATRDGASELLLAELLDHNLPPPPQDYVPPTSGGKAASHVHPISQLMTELNRLCAAGFDVVQGKPKFEERSGDIERRFSIRSWPISVQGHSLSLLPHSGRNKQCCKTEAAEDLLRQLEGLRPLLMAKDQIREPQKDYGGPLNSLLGSWRRRHGNEIGKIMRRVVPGVLDQFEASFAVTVYGVVYEGGGSGISRTAARNAAAKALFEKLTAINIEMRVDEKNSLRQRDG